MARGFGLTTGRLLPSLAGALITVFSAVSGFAQTANPRVVEFFPSPDHDVFLASGQPAVSRYLFEVYLQGASAPFQTTDMGKPAPQADGVIRYDFSGQVVGWPLPGGVYESRVAATGPNGTSRSGMSNPFTLSSGAACSYVLSQAAVSIGSPGGSASVAVSTSSGCAWTTSSSTAWIGVTPAGGSGSSSATLAVAANATTAARTGTVTIAGQAVTVTQAGAPCTWTVAPASVTVGAEGGPVSVTVTTSAGCGWSATSDAAWVGVTPGSGTDTGAVTLTVAANATTATRTGTVTVAGQAVTVTQAAAPCTWSVAPASVTLGADGGPASVTVTTLAGCGWSATSDAAWLGVTPANGSGSGSATLTVAANVTTAARTGTVTIAGQTVMVTQAAAPCTWSVAPATVSIASEGGMSAVAVTTGAGCTWSATSDAAWIGVTPGSGTDTGAVTLTVAANATTATRTGTVTVAGQAVTVTQAAAPCTWSVAPATVSIASEGGMSAVAVTTGAGCTWSATSDADWVSLSPGSSADTGAVTLTVAANATTAARTGTVTVAGQTVMVTQAAAPCTWSVTPTTVSVASDGGTSAVTVTTGVGCAWSATSDAAWMGVTPGSGTDTGAVTLTVAANATTATRTGTVTVAGQAVTVTQAAAPCTWSVTPTTVSVASEGGASAVTVTTVAGCAWSATSDAAWVGVTPGSGTDTGAVTLAVAANATTATRTGTVTVAGQAVTVTQVGTDIPTGLVAGYGFDEGSGSTTADASGNGNTGTLSGATWTAQGKFGSALVFNGASVVTIADAPTLDLDLGMTLEAWVYPTGASSWTTVMMKEQPGGLAYGLYAAGWTANAPSAFVSVPAERGLAGPSALALNTWSHLAATYDGATLRLYVNGVQVAGLPITGSIATSSGALRIGGNSVWGEYLQGRLDEVRVYNRVLSAAELQRDMNQPIGGAPDTRPPTAPTGLSATTTGTGQITLSWTAATDDIGVTGYRVERCAGATCANWAEITPTPVAATSLSDSGLAAGTLYRYRVRASDAAGNGSDYSDVASATTTTPCGFAVTPASVSVASGGGTSAVTVTTGAGCPWSATSDADWVGITPGSGADSGAVTLTVDANAATRARTATLTVAGQVVTVTQAAASCTFTASPTTVSVASEGGSSTVTVTTGADCPWSATSDADWVGVTPGSGADSGAVTLTVAANATPSPRTGTVAIAGQAVTVTQVGTEISTGLVAAYGFDEGTGSTTGDASGNGNAGTLSGASWTTQGRFGGALVFNGASVVTIADAPTLDLGSGMTLEAWVYPTATSSWATVVMKEQPEGLAYGLYAAGWTANAPSAFVSVPAERGLAGPSALALNTWSHLAATYDGTTLRLYVNGSQAARLSITGTIVTSSGALRIGGNAVWGEYFRGRLDEVRVYNRVLSAADLQRDMNQPVGGIADTTPPTAPTGLSATATGTGQITLSWNAAADDVGVTGYRLDRCAGAACTNWAEITPTPVAATSLSDSGLAAGTLYRYRVRAVDVAGNAGDYSDVASATTAMPCGFTVAPTSVAVGGEGGAVPVNVAADPACAWTASSAMAWVAVTPGSGAGSGTVTLTVGTNATNATRMGTVTIAGQAVTVTQAGLSACTYVVSPTDFPAPATGQTYTVSVTTGTECAWQGTSDSAWVTLSPSNATGSAAVSVVVATNMGTASRTATLAIAGQYVGISQSGQPTAGASGPGDGLRGEYFDNANLTAPVLARVDPTLDFNWGTGAPASGMGVNTFSVRWTGRLVAPTSETYTFYTVSDDGVRLWVNGELVIDNWTTHAPTENSGSVSLIAGQPYEIKLEYFEYFGGAVARLLWSSPSTPKAVVPKGVLFSTVSAVTSASSAIAVGDAEGTRAATGDATASGLLGEYFDNADLTSPAFSRTDMNLDFDWGTRAPEAGMGADTFSVRWTGRIQAQASGQYTFYTMSDDGVRLWVNGDLLINNWTIHEPTQDRGSITLAAGQWYDIRLEYFENDGTALMQLFWSTPSMPRTVIPSFCLSPPADTATPVGGGSSGDGLRGDCL